MSRRRLIAIVFGALIGVFLAGSAVTIKVVNDQLISAVDDDLRVGLDLQTQVLERFDSFDELGDLTAVASETTTVVVSPTGDMDVLVQAGSAFDRIPLPKLTASKIIAHDGDSFTADGRDGGPEYRVAVDKLDDGRFVALAKPIDDVDSTLRALSQILLLTLLGVVTVLGVIFWLILRASLRPYDDMVDTAEAIAAGDMDRRAQPSSSIPEIATLANSLNTMLDQLQESFDAKVAAELRVKQFAADASHELRTPLTTIRGYSELYLSGAATAPDDVGKQMSRINGEATRMGRLVDELLTLARLDQGRGLNFESVDLRALARHVVDDARAAHPDLAVTTDLPDHEVMVLGDADALHQVVSNLVTNSRVHAPGSPVELSLDDTEERIILNVRDHGPGMTRDVADHAFDRFYRADTVRQSSTDSSGLGLSIVQAIVEAHGGTISLDTEPGAGAEFAIVFSRTG